ncbi:hypothetical protein [Burkholderia cepacia]|uniref:hypothetical protein n=1 Tax=Burkholderia cepacia TaxID=292 RepID=UPI001CF468F1|nr:hypothetical protein [Burkholderia cepacia]MCA8133948.1 hypothetical protein [Burkholderia cepacia]
MANFSLQLQADNLPIEVIEELLVEGPWKPAMARMLTGENILLEGCRGVGKTMLMRAATQRLQKDFLAGGKVLGVHATFKRYLATLPPPSPEANDSYDLANFRAWTNARILGATFEAVRAVRGDDILARLGDLGETDWSGVVGVLETTYRRGVDAQEMLASIGLKPHVIGALQGYTYTARLLQQVVNELGLDLLVLFLDDAAHALDTRAQGAFFTAIKSLYEPRLAFKISVYPAVTRYGIDFSYGHDAVVVSLGETPKFDNAAAFHDLLAKRKLVADDAGSQLLDAILSNAEWWQLLFYCANANPRGLLKLVAQVQTQMGARAPAEMRFEDIRLAINTVMDKHLDNMVPGVIKDLDSRLLKASEYLLDEFRQKISDKPGPYEGSRPRGYLAVTNSMQVAYICQAALKLLVAANVVIPEGPARLSKRETGTLYLLHPGFIFRDNVIGPFYRGTLTAAEWLGFFKLLSSRVHAEITKSAELWAEIVSEVSSEPSSKCESGHPMFDARATCEVCGARAVVISPVQALLDKDIEVLEISDNIKERLRDSGFLTVRQLFEASDAQLDAVEYIGEVRITMIRNAVSAAVDEFVAG